MESQLEITIEAIKQTCEMKGNIKVNSVRFTMHKYNVLQ